MIVDMVLSNARLVDSKTKGSLVNKVGYGPRIINFHLTRIKALLTAVKRL